MKWFFEKISSFFKIPYLVFFFKEWYSEHPKTILTLIAGYAFAGSIAWYSGHGSVKFVYDKPEVKFEHGIDDNHAPHKIEYIERVFVENKTDHPFDICAAFGFGTMVFADGISLVAPKNWKVEPSAYIEENEKYTVASDDYGKLGAHDYYKAKEVINIAPPPNMTMAQFKDALLAMPVTILLTSSLFVKYPETETKVFKTYLPFQDILTAGIKDPGFFYPKK